jgi:putative NIF3 family GTP cyclohydrolase 1 type 2
VTTVRALAAALESIYPLSSALPDDPTGPQLGRLDRRVSSVFVALDPDREAIRAATRLGAEVLVTHHPLWWKPPRRRIAPSVAPAARPGLLPPTRLTADLAAARPALEAIERGLAILAAHTNADFAAGGLCDALAKALGLGAIAPLRMEGEIPVGRLGETARPVAWPVFRKLLRRRFGGAIRLAGSPPRLIRRVAVSSGSGADLLADAIAAGADLLVTGDVKYHAARIAAETKNFALVDAGHFETERLFIPLTAAALRRRFPQLKIRVHRPHTPFRRL